MSKNIQLTPGVAVTAGDTCWQVMPRQDYADQDAFLHAVIGLFTMAGRENGVTFGDFTVDETTGTTMINGEPHPDPSATLWRATAVAA